MARYTENLTVDGRASFNVFNTRGRDAAVELTVTVSGTFGGGTAAFQVSPDDGTTWVNATDDCGTEVSLTADGARRVLLCSDPENPVLFGVNLSGATSPDLNVTIFQAR